MKSVGFNRTAGQKQQPRLEKVPATLEAKVKKIVCDLLAVAPKEVTPHSDLTIDLGADSLDLVELVMDCEAQFKVEIDDEDGSSVKTFQNLVDVVKKNGGA